MSYRSGELRKEWMVEHKDEYERKLNAKGIESEPAKFLQVSETHCVRKRIVVVLRHCRD